MKIKIDGIRKQYRRAQVLSGVSFEAGQGMMVGILGQNGCGKSTLLSILAGTLRSDRGSFLYEGDNGRKSYLLKNHALSSRLIGYVPQSTPILEELTALDNRRLWYTGGHSMLKKELEEGILAELQITGLLNKNVSNL